MTATERLRQLLDERGVESGYPHTLRPELHRSLNAAGIDYWVSQGLTFWNCSDGRECVAYGYQVNGKPRLAMKIVGITDPEQAVEATLGRGTCRMTLADLRGPAYTDVYECSECGHQTMVYTVMDESEPPRYCPNCGREVEQ